ncbi:MAG: thioredoxin family protein [Candidatus Kariarchaeaceae archaeon]
MDKMKIEIFGKGCKNCETLEQNVREALTELNIEADISKVKDMDDIVERGVFKTPGLAINGKVVSTGRVLSSKKIRDFLN